MRVIGGRGASEVRKISGERGKLPYTLLRRLDWWPPSIRARAIIGVFRHWNYRSAKRPVIQICMHCSALLLEAADNCSFCDAPLVDGDENLEAVPVGVSAPVVTDETADSAEPEWRREVSRRLEAYRVRRGRPRPNDSQSGLPFVSSAAAAEKFAGTHEIALYEEDAGRPRPRATQRAIQKQRQNERVEINIQPELDFSASADDRAHPQTALVPVASLNERRWAGLLDALFLALTYAGFLGLFRSLGGQLVMEKVDAVVYLAAFFLFYAQIFFSIYDVRGRHPGDAASRADHRAPGRQSSRHAAASVAQLRVRAFRSSDTRIFLGFVGRRSVHLAGSNQPDLHYRRDSAHGAGSV
jgi:hypothetical protein